MELWDSYWRQQVGRGLDATCAAMVHGMLDWANASTGDELAYRLATDLCTATAARRCALIDSGRKYAGGLVAMSGMADVKAQSVASADWIKSVKRYACACVHNQQSFPCLSLQMGRSQRAVIEWADVDHYLASRPVLTATWPLVMQAWRFHQGQRGRSFWNWVPQPTRFRVLALLGVLLVAGGLWATRDWPLNLTITCPGRLEPAQQLWLFAPADGHIAQVSVSDRQLVALDQVVVTVASPSLDLQLQALTSEMETLQQKRVSLDVLLSETNSSTESGSREARRIAGEILDIDLRIKGLDEQRRSLQQERQKLEVRSRMSGRVIGTDLAERLNQKPVRTGDYLMRIVDEQSPWQLELNLPERELGHVHRALHASAGKLAIRFSILGMPGQSYAATLTRVRSSVEPSDTVSGEGTVKLVADVGERVGDVPLGSQVLATIDTGPQPWWKVLARPTIESLQRRGWL